MNEVLNTTEEISIKSRTNPFPGLRPFGVEESHLFFGREGQSGEVLAKLSQNRFVAVIGASGTGKSSLIYCGLIPVLYGGFITVAGSKWRILTCRPGNSPIDNIAGSIAKSTAGDKDEHEIKLQKSFYSAILRRSSLGLTDALRQLPNSKDENILLLVDQFEELFRYRFSRKGHEAINEAGAYVKLLIEAVNQTEFPVYIVLTMRSDFIGECSNFQELTTMINRSNYLIPQMTRADFRDAINGPVAVGNASIEPALVQELLNDVGDNPDQLPILQHAMMRTWDYWLKNSDRDKPLGISEYEAIGKMEKALSEHANEAYDELSDEGKRICEILFKTITEKGADNRGVRRPTRLEDIAEIAKADTAEVITVVEKFRIAGRSFLTPSFEIPLSSESVIDLSHESLMRIWNRLKTWVEEESNAVQMYLRLSEASALFQQGKTGLWRPPDLQIALNWEKKQQPTLAWAQRHNPAFERAIVFLQTSAKEYEAEELNKIKLQKRALKRSKTIAVVLGIAALISLGIMVFAQMKSTEAFEQNKIATRQSILASIQKSFAEKNLQTALEQRKIALKRTQEAIEQKEIADEQSRIAEMQKVLALRSAQEAEKQKNIANQKSLEANEQKKLAEKNAKDAIDQKTEAEKAREEAYNRRMVSVAQSMAIKSQQIDDVELKSLLSYRSFLFNEKYQGSTHSPDVYAGLYKSLISQYGRSWNTFKGHNDAVNSIVFWPSASVFYTAGSDGKVIRWDLSDSLRKPQVLIANKFVNKSIDISNDGQWIAIGTYGGGIGILNLKEKNSDIRYFPNLGINIESVKFSPDGKSLIACSDTNLLEFNLNTGAGIITGTDDGILLSLAISSDGKLVAAGTKNGKIILWNRNLGFKKEILNVENKNQIHALAFNFKGDRLASGNILGYLKIWDIAEKKMLSNVRGHSARITDIKFSPDDKMIASSSYDQSILLWNTADVNAQPVKLKDHESWVLSLAFSPFSDKLISGSVREERMILWPTRTYEIATLVLKKISRDLTEDEWKTYVGADITYEKTR